MTMAGVTIPIKIAIMCWRAAKKAFPAVGLSSSLKIRSVLSLLSITHGRLLYRERDINIIVRGVFKILKGFSEIYLITQSSSGGKVFS